MAVRIDLRRAAREIFAHALKRVDAYDAVRRAVRLEGSRLTIGDTSIDLSARPGGIYALALGKAASPMATALDEALGEKIKEGLIAGPYRAEDQLKFLRPPRKFRMPWHLWSGGHPLPNKSSLRAAQAAFALLERANELRGLVIFLISGGGSAMMEWPRDERIKIGEIRRANRLLVSCGASIAEINAVRIAFSAIKGGGLVARAPQAEKLSLIISDTPIGQESIVASGPTYPPPPSAPDAASVIERYHLAETLPASIMRAVAEPREMFKEESQSLLRRHHVLLDNDCALEAAKAMARRLGFMVEIALDISEQSINEGCALMLSRLDALKERAAETKQPACLISGGEFACPVRGKGCGGRNSETVLRCAIELNERLRHDASKQNSGRVVVLSAGTDGIDGNSPAAGAIADETTIERARKSGLDAQEFLDGSDAYSFFNHLGDAIVTGQTGTNVRDVRLLLAD